MPQSSYLVTASLLYFEPPVAAPGQLADGLTAVLEDLALQVTGKVIGDDRSVVLQTIGPDIRVNFCGAPMDKSEFAHARRPDWQEAGDMIAMRRLSFHRATISLSVDPKPEEGRYVLSVDQCLALCHRLVRQVLAVHPGELVFWHPNEMIFTVEEFSELSEIARPVQPRRPRVEATQVQELKARRPSPLDLRMPVDTVDSGSTFVQPRRPVFTTEAPVLAAPPIGELAPIAGGIEDRVASRMSQLRHALTEVAPRLSAENTTFVMNEKTLPSRLSVYVLNTTVMLLAFPVGMGLLTYNILKGESMNVTARALALTGTGLGFNEVDSTHRVVEMVTSLFT
jgi:hypothetical protein